MHSSTTGTYYYSLFDLTIASELKLEGLENGDPVDQPDLEIVVGQGRPEAFELPIDDVATYRISDGNRIAIEPAAGSDPRDIRLFLLGSAIGIALHQRGMLPLHANAIVIKERAVAFMGRSGVGKSTLAAWFHDQGHSVLADDVCVVRFGEDGQAMALPGLARIRLWSDALEASGRDASAHPKSFSWDEGHKKKYDVLTERHSALAATPLAGLYLLEDGADVDAVKLEGAEAAEVLMANTYRGQLIREIGNQAVHFSHCTRLASEVPLYRLSRPLDRDRFGQIARKISDLVAK